MKHMYTAIALVHPNFVDAKNQKALARLIASGYFQDPDTSIAEAIAQAVVHKAPPLEFLGMTKKEREDALKQSNG